MLSLWSCPKKISADLYKKLFSTFFLHFYPSHTSIVATFGNSGSDEEHVYCSMLRSLLLILPPCVERILCSIDRSKFNYDEVQLNISLFLLKTLLSIFNVLGILIIYLEVCKICHSFVLKNKDLSDIRC